VRRRRAQEGLTLIELLLTATLSLVVLFGALSGFEAFGRAHDRLDRQAASQEEARTALARIAREVRNVAGAGEQPTLVERAGPADLVVQSVDPVGPNAGANAENVRRVRYCLGAPGPAGAVLWTQVQAWTTASPPAAPSDTACPGAGWPSSHQLSRGIVNTAGGASRRVFSYDAPALGDISRVTISLYVDTAADRVPERHLSSEVFLRNQNRAPVAAFTVTPIGNRHVLLNGAASQDPDGQYLTYAWTADGAPIGYGTVLDHEAPASGAVVLGLTVTDTGGLSDAADAQTVVVQ
jgi:hypothetical protein